MCIALRFVLGLATALVLANCGGDRESHSISGSTGVPGASVSLSGKAITATMANPDGHFSFSQLENGSYVVTPSDPAFLFDPSNSQVTIADSDANVSFAWEHAFDALPEEVLERIDRETDTEIAPDEIVFGDGRPLYGAAAPLSPLVVSAAKQALLDRVIRTLVNQARAYACGRTKSPCRDWDYAADPADPTKRPAQQGLVYVYGGMTPELRTAPTGPCSHHELHGMDCSGMITLIAQKAGITLLRRRAVQQQELNAWALPSGLRMEDVTGKPMQSGDIVGWEEHIGIVVSGGGLETVISSTGSRKTCEANMKRGPRSLTVKQLSMGPPRKVLRITAIPDPSPLPDPRPEGPPDWPDRPWPEPWYPPGPTNR